MQQHVSLKTFKKAQVVKKAVEMNKERTLKQKETKESN
jgi:hypothetical protein